MTSYKIVACNPLFQTVLSSLLLTQKIYNTESFHRVETTLLDFLGISALACVYGDLKLFSRSKPLQCVQCFTHQFLVCSKEGC